MGAVTPIGNNVADFWQSLTDGKHGFAPITRFDTTDFKVKLAAEVKNFDTDKYFDKLEARKLDPYTQFALAAAAEAMDDSGIINNIASERLGVYVGSGIGGIQSLLNNYDTMRDRGSSRVSAAVIPMVISNIAAGQIAIKYNARGPVLPIVTACASATHEIGEAFFAIQSGRADAILAGGAEASINNLLMAGFSSAQALSTSDDPNAALLPFDARRAGFVMGEGAGMLVLEEYQHAKNRNAKIYCEMVAYSNTCDAHHITAPSPDADGCIRMIREAITMADIQDTEQIYFNAHGTGTLLNDKTETLALKSVFGEGAHKIAISSTKSMHGHMMGATGAVEAIASIKTLTDGIIPPTINLSEPDPDCDLNYTPNAARKLQPDIAMTENLGFGGHNAVLVFRKIKED
jgi:3-oxoacyl-[acyl-carrier-protein] synthase II